MRKLNILYQSIAMLALLQPCNAEEKNIYVIPQEAQCSVRKADKITYCIEKRTGEPITGELHRYFNNNLKSVYPLTNGILEGAAYAYYTNGTVKSEKPYSQGKLNGIVKEYTDKGQLIAETPYENGLQEGVAKYYNTDGTILAQAIYENGKTNGEMRIYVPDGTVLYSFINEDGMFVSGTYSYLSDRNSIITTKIPTVIINAFNHKCLEMQTELTYSACSAVYSPLDAINNCDKSWRKANRQAVREYLKKCAEESEESNEHK